MTLGRSLFGWRLISKLPMAHLASGVSDVAADAKQAYRQYQRECCHRGRSLGPLKWCNDRYQANSRRKVVDVDQPLCTAHVRIEPCLAIIVRHRMHALIALLAIDKNRPCRCRTNDDKNKCDNLGLTTPNYKGGQQSQYTHR